MGWRAYLTGHWAHSSAIVLRSAVQCSVGWEQRSGDGSSFCGSELPAEGGVSHVFPFSAALPVATAFCTMASAPPLPEGGFPLVGEQTPEQLRGMRSGACGVRR